MHVLILAQYYPPDLGGSTTRAYNVARGLANNDVQVTVIAAFPHYPHGNIPNEYRWKPFVREYDEGIQVIRTLMMPLESKGMVFRLLTFLTFILSSLTGLFLVDDVDAVWAANKDIFGLIPGLVYRWRFNCPLVFNVDDLSVKTASNLGVFKEDGFLNRFAESISRFFYQRVDAVTPLSPGYYSTINRFGISLDRIFLVRSGVDLDTFTNKRSSGNCYRIAYSGSFSIAYDFKQIAQAADLLRDHPDIEFIIQGKGELYESIKQSIHEYKLQNMKVVDMIMTRQEVASFLGEADVLILPLTDFGVPYLGISSKLYEYQALGKPIICCSEGQSSEYVKVTCSGIVVNPGDYKALAKAVMYLHDNPDKAEKMGQSGREFVLRHAGIDQIGLEMKHVIEHVIRQRR